MWPYMHSIGVQEDIDEEVEEEGEGIQNEDVGNVRDMCIGKKFHLLFSSAHEKETGSVKKLSRSQHIRWIRSGHYLQKAEDAESY